MVTLESAHDPEMHQQNLYFIINHKFSLSLSLSLSLIMNLNEFNNN